MQAATEERGPWASEGVDVLRAVSGGLLFGIPLLYTMEVWWIGASTSPARLLLVLLLTFVPVLVLNRTGGFREDTDVSWVDALKDTVEAVAIGIVSAAVLLVLLREITTDTPLTEGLGKALFESTPFGIGAGLARHLLHRGRNGDPDDEDGGGSGEGEDAGEAAGSEGGRTWNATVADIGATAIGAIFIAFNIAPTDEVPMITAAMTSLWLVALIGASLVVSYVIVFEAGFSNEDQRRSQQGLLQRPSSETVAAYLVSLVCAALMLWFFGRIGQGEPLRVSLDHVVVLGLPAAVGGAAGRLAI